MNKTLNSLPRRQMLAGSASALAAAGLATFTRGAAAAGETPVASATPKPLPAYVAWKDPASVIVHSSTTIETKRAAFGSGVITPAEQLYIRNNLPAPVFEFAGRDGRSRCDDPGAKATARRRCGTRSPS